MAKKKQKQEKKPYTATDAVSDVVELVVVTPVAWLWGSTVGLLLDG